MTGTSLGPVVADLETVLALGAGRLSDDALTDLRRLRDRVDERLAAGDAITVAALAGGTGVGKSALANALTGVPLSTEGVVRPTTSVPVALGAVDDGAASRLLDWLEVAVRRTTDRLPTDLLLLDLPDHDSVVDEHRRISDRLTARVDVLVWVTDPVKYARADLHDQRLAALVAHAPVVLVVLNRTDELASAGDVAACTADLRRRLAGHGLDAATVLTTSARTGGGVDVLRAHLGAVAAQRTAAARRLVADAAALARTVRAHTPELAGPPDAFEVVPVVQAVAPEVGVDLLLAEAAGHYRTSAARTMRSPLARTVRRPVGLVPSIVPRRTATGPTRLADPERVRAAVLRAAGAAQLTGPTYAVVHDHLDAVAARAAPWLSDAVEGVALAPTPRRWWRVASAARFVAEATLLTGAVWLLALAVLDWLRLPELPVPMVTDALPLPTALLVGGLLVRVVIGLLGRAPLARGAARHRRRVERDLQRRLAEAVETHVVGPVQAEGDDRRRLAEALQRLAGSAPAAGGDPGGHGPEGNR